MERRCFSTDECRAAESPKASAKRLLAEVRKKTAEKPAATARPGLGRDPELLRFEAAGERLVQAARTAGPALLREAIWKAEALRKELRGLGKKR